jgi:hypothetical protein
VASDIFVSASFSIVAKSKLLEAQLASIFDRFISTQGLISSV